MIEIFENTFHLYTDNTSYLFSISEGGFAEHIYYGRRLKDAKLSLTAIREKHLIKEAMSPAIDRSRPNFTLNDTLLEFSTEGNGDYKLPSIAISYAELGERDLSLRFSKFRIDSGIREIRDSVMPQAIANENEAETLSITYTDESKKISLIEVYTTFDRADVIARRNIVVNNSRERVILRSLSSASLDFRGRDFEAITLNGAYGRERNLTTTPLKSGAFTIESRHPSSSFETNPAFAIKNGNDVYMMNLIYSGAFKATMSVSSQDLVHITWGINDSAFSWPLENGEEFESPEALLCYSPEGSVGASERMHIFITHHIGRGLYWSDKLRPILYSTGEIYRSNLDEASIVNTAERISSLGFEGLILDDGWFGARSDRTSSLGDWYVNTKRFPSGLRATSNEIHRRGMMFGLWIAPEEISERSQAYKEHKDFIIEDNIATAAVSDNAYLLDLTREDVQAWLSERIINLIREANVDILKWDTTRYAAAFHSNSSLKAIGTFAHRYILGLYAVLKRIISAFPRLLLLSEGRVDLGILSFMPLASVSKAADPLERVKSVEGAMTFYPPSLLSSRLAESPDSATHRIMGIETRFNSAIFGCLSYSLTLGSSTDKGDLATIKRQLDFYKSYRALFQFGHFKHSENDDRIVWSMSNHDSSTIMILYMKKLLHINGAKEKLKIEAANSDYIYSFFARDYFIKSDLIDSFKGMEEESYIISGDAARYAGIALFENDTGVGYQKGMRTLTDFDSRLYILRRVKGKIKK